MIGNINRGLAEKVVRMTPEVRKYVVDAKEQGEFRTQADAWLHLVLSCNDYDPKVKYSWHQQDSFRWRQVSSIWSEILLLRSLLLSEEFSWDEMEERQGDLLVTLQNMAHQGLESMNAETNEA